MNIKEIISQTKKRAPISQLEIEVILAHTLNKSRVFLFTYPKTILTNKQLSLFNKLIKQRINGTPLAHLTNKQEFYGYEFFVDKNVLIPRPETELMVDWAKDKIKTLKNNTLIIDIGTGSGCINISLAKELEKKNNLNTAFLSLDISQPALAIAKKNAKKNQVEKLIKFKISDLLSSISSKYFQPFTNILILANLPYLTNDEAKSNELKKEPKLALAAGNDGLLYYDKLIEYIYLNKEIFLDKTSVLFEIDPAQKKNISSKLKINNFKDVKIIKDLRKKDRFVSASF